MRIPVTLGLGLLSLASVCSLERKIVSLFLPLTFVLLSFLLREKAGGERLDIMCHRPLPRLSDRDKITSPAIMWLTSTSVTDVLIAATLCILLLGLGRENTSGGGPKSFFGHGIIKHLVLATISTGSASAVIAAASLAFYLNNNNKVRAPLPLRTSSPLRRLC